MNKKKLVVNELLDYFEKAKIEGVNDNDWTIFTCKLCGWSFEHWIPGHPFPPRLEEVRQRILEHLAVRHNIDIPLRI